MEFLWLLSFVLLSISALSSVVSDGSPESFFAIVLSSGPLCMAISLVAEDLVRGRFDGGFTESVEMVFFLCLWLEVAGTAESSASSPDASRLEGWSRSAVEDFGMFLGSAEGLFLLAELPEEEGEDMVIRCRVDRIQFRSDKIPNCG
jgi:hypothetical protein